VWCGVNFTYFIPPFKPSTQPSISHSLLPSYNSSIFLSFHSFSCQFVFTISQSTFFHSFHLFIHLSLHQSTYSFIYLSITPSFHLFIHLSFTHLPYCFFYLDNLQHIRLSTCHSLHPFTYSFIFRSIAKLFFLIVRLQHICLFICHSLLPSTDLSIFLLFICQFMFTTSQLTTHWFIHFLFTPSFH